MSRTVDMRTCLNALSDVLINRPQPLREFDQIYMKLGDVLLHIDHICTWFRDLDVVFIGDGDAVALALMHLDRKAQIAAGPRSIHVLDFDERVVGSIQRFAKMHDLTDRVRATYYNVKESLPNDLLGAFNAFHTNPPFGMSNGGRSVEVFIRRGVEACGDDCRGCVVLADDDSLQWTQEVLGNVQQFIVADGFMISELRPKVHQYHLDDAPDLTSCTLLVKRQRPRGAPARSLPISTEDCQNFYGKGMPLIVSRIKDKTAAGRLPSRDHDIVYFNEDDQSHGGHN